MDSLQDEFERWVGDRVIDHYNTDHGTSFRFHGRAGEAPDLEYRDGSRSLRVGVTSAFYDDKNDDGKHAKFIWLAARKRPDAPHKLSSRDCDEKLVKNINARLADKCSKSYGANCVLTVFALADLTRVWEMESRLEDIRIPATNRFDAIYLCGEFPSGIESPGGFRIWKLPIEPSVEIDGG
jgi:hypothetical protein